jgi:HAD superfamily hydrolase (TIGR01509 family)
VAIKAVLFDHDGTLVDSEPTHWRLWQDVLRTHGAELTEQHYKDYYAGMPTAANAADLAERFAIDKDPAALAEDKYAITRRFLSRNAFPLMPGVREVLPLFQAGGLRLGIVTGAGRNGVEATLRAHKLHGVFETIVTSDDVKYSKPAPDCYLLAAKKLGLAPEDCVAIEDTEHGVAAAAAAGVACLAVPNEMSKHHDFGKATQVFGDLIATVAWVTAAARP